MIIDEGTFPDPWSAEEFEAVREAHHIYPEATSPEVTALLVEVRMQPTDLERDTRTRS